jgi:hypothetical protein
MIGGLATRWLLTAVFAPACLGATLPQREPAGSTQVADRVSATLCSAMCAALVAMTWWSEPTAATWLQAALFGCAAIWFGLVSMAGSGRVRRPSMPAVLHTLMAGAMVWMLTGMPAMTGMTATASAGNAMTSVARGATPAPVVAVSIVLAVSCAAASVPWLARAIGPGRRLQDAVAASQAAMTAGMAAMLVAML